MSLGFDYPCGEAINDLQVFLKRHIRDVNELNRFLDYLTECKNAGRIGFRFVHEELMKYREKYSDYFLFDSKERQMIDELFHFWG